MNKHIKKLLFHISSHFNFMDPVFSLPFEVFYHEVLLLLLVIVTLQSLG